MNTTDETLRVIALKYIEGQASEQEQKLLLKSLQSEEGKQLLSGVVDKEMENVWKEPGILNHAVSERMKQRLLEAIGTNEAEEESQPGNFPWLRIAASLIIIALVGVGSFVGYQKYQTTTIATTAGQTETIVLPDQSTVTLNSNSSISYKRVWAEDGIREVQLNGEAYFDVVHNVERPFIVHTSNIDVRVLGTSFNVRSYKEDENIETTLIRGKVAINSSTDKERPELILAPNQKAVFNKESEDIVMTTVKADVEVSWKSGKLIYEDKPFGEIVMDLQRKYDVTFDVKDKASLKCRFRAIIEHESLQEVMEIFKSTTGLDYELSGSKVIVKGTLCTTQTQ